MRVSDQDLWLVEGNSCVYGQVVGGVKGNTNMAVIKGNWVKQRHHFEGTAESILVVTSEALTPIPDGSWGSIFDTLINEGI